MIIIPRPPGLTTPFAVGREMGVWVVATCRSVCVKGEWCSLRMAMALWLALAPALVLGLLGFPGAGLSSLSHVQARPGRAGKWQGTEMPHVSWMYLPSLPIHSVRPGVHRNRCCT